MPIVWNPTQARYRDTETGRFVSRDTVLDYVRQSIESSGEVTKTLAERVSSGQLSSREFLTVFKQEIKDEYIRQYVAGRGGLGSMTQSDWGSLGSMLKEKYKYANNFASELSCSNIEEPKYIQYQYHQKIVDEDYVLDTTLGDIDIEYTWVLQCWSSLS